MLSNKFSIFFLLFIVGKIDAATIKLMNTDRCGLGDPISMSKGKRKRRFNLQGSTWKKVIEHVLMFT